MLSNTTQHIYDYIARNPIVSSTDIVKYTNLHPNKVNYHLRILRKLNLIYVSEWIQNSRNVPTMVLSAGNKLDAPKPPIKLQALKKHEKKLKVHAKFTPRPDEAAAWLMNPITQSSTDMSAR
jgi:DNA-binding MarR family transcriptional regulator